MSLMDPDLQRSSAQLHSFRKRSRSEGCDGDEDEGLLIFSVYTRSVTAQLVRTLHSCSLTELWWMWEPQMVLNSESSHCEAERHRLTVRERERCQEERKRFSWFTQIKPLCQSTSLTLSLFIVCGVFSGVWCGVALRVCWRFWRECSQLWSSAWWWFWCELPGEGGFIKVQKLQSSFLITLRVFKCASDILLLHFSQITGLNRTPGPPVWRRWELEMIAGLACLCSLESREGSGFLLSVVVPQMSAQFYLIAQNHKSKRCHTRWNNSASYTWLLLSSGSPSS